MLMLQIYLKISLGCVSTKIALQQLSQNSKGMGTNCIGCVSGDRQREIKNSKFWTVPDDINTYDRKRRLNLPKIKFVGLLYNVRILNYPKVSVSLKFEVEELLEVLLPRKGKEPDSSDIKWKLKENFEFEIDEYELRLKFLVITAIDESNKPIDSLKINLYKLATGPYHNDFSILRKADVRLQFDLKISQCIQMKILCESAQAFIYKKDYPGESFNFSFLVLGEEKEEPFESEASYSIVNPFQPIKAEPVTSQYEECPSPIKIKRRATMKSIKNQAHFTWAMNKGEMPNFELLLKSHELKKTVLNFVIWRLSSQTNISMFCSAYISVSKMLNLEMLSSEAPAREQKLEQRAMNIENEVLWCGEQRFGEFSMRLKIENGAYIKQMNACTRTENGIIQSIPFFGNYRSYRGKDSESTQYSLINDCISKLEEINKQLNFNTSLSGLAIQRLRERFSKQLQNLQKIFENELEKTFFIPTNQKQSLKMLGDQALLLSVVDKVVNYSQDDSSMTEVCWKIILAIMKRGEFTLTNIGFSKTDVNDMEKQRNSFYKKKVKTSIQYQEMLYKLLQLALRIGYVEGREETCEAVEMFKAYCYFRVPLYRDMVLKKVVRKQDESIEWRGGIVDCDADVIPEAQAILAAQLDWENGFYNPLQGETRSCSLNKELSEILENNVWLDQISKRKGTFFYFVYFLVKRLSELGKKIKFLKWQYFPGYNKLVRGFLSQMRSLRIQNYPPSLKYTSVNLLDNEKLLNILISCIFEKTNLNQCNTLMKSLDLVSRYLNHFSKNQRPFPPTFNFVYFLKALKIVVEGEFSFAVNKCLAIIFNNYDNFNIQFRRNLALYLMGKVFFKLFLNWSHPTRNSFFHILILKIQKSSDIFNADSRKQFSNKHELMNEIATRYDYCMKLVKQVHEKHSKQTSTIWNKGEKQLYKVMKKKLAFRKKSFEEPTIYIKNLTKNLKTQEEGLNNTSFKLGHDTKPAQYFGIKQGYEINLRPIGAVDLADRRANQQLLSVQEAEEQFVARTRSGSTYFDFNLIEEQWKNANPQPQPKIRERKKSFCDVEDFEVQQIQGNQVEYLALALKQFHQLDTEIKKHYIKTGELPVCELEVEVPIDESEIKPSADFEEWQSKQQDEGQ